ncbi:MAG: hypothetical protein QHD01_03080 [Bradyrhizobium sp.]|uniref:hypothetical protein n=1 Tax=Bradyrhizobium sp. TaxID=376 RepID=UPI0029BAB0EE|nr:hypothetical protein [Bradyrhizobium sp.]MDX3965564.1 hypothetical protein [Bradyrhizobium sp.]
MNKFTIAIKPEIRALHRTPEQDELVAFIADYCRKNPKGPFADAALTLDARMNSEALERIGAIADEASKRKQSRRSVGANLWGSCSRTRSHERIGLTVNRCGLNRENE